MKLLLLPIAFFSAILLVSPAFAISAKRANKMVKHASRNEAREALREFDANQNNRIDGTEREELRKAFETDPSLKSLDLNGDGRLDESEIDAIKPHRKKSEKAADKAAKANEV